MTVTGCDNDVRLGTAEVVLMLCSVDEEREPTSAPFDETGVDEVVGIVLLIAVGAEGAEEDPGIELAEVEALGEGPANGGKI